MKISKFISKLINLHKLPRQSKCGGYYYESDAIKAIENTNDKIFVCKSSNNDCPVIFYVYQLGSNMGLLRSRIKRLYSLDTERPYCDSRPIKYENWKL